MYLVELKPHQIEYLKMILNYLEFQGVFDANKTSQILEAVKNAEGTGTI